MASIFSHLFENPKQDEKRQKQIKSEIIENKIRNLSRSFQIIEQNEKKIRHQMKINRSKASQYLDENKKEKAIEQLKFYETHKTQLSIILKKKQNIYSIITNLRNAQLNMETYKSIEEGKECFQMIYQGVDIDVIDNSIMDIQESEAISSEMESTLSSPFSSNASMNDELDDDIILRFKNEISSTSTSGGSSSGQQLEKVSRKKDLIDIDELPEVPTHKIASKKTNLKMSKRKKDISQKVGLF